MIEIALSLTSEKSLPHYQCWLGEGGLKPVLVSTGIEVRKFPALVLGGGGDMGKDSGAYHSTPKEGVLSFVSEERDGRERELLSSVPERGYPVLGICRGLQVMNVFLGGSLWADIGQGGWDLSTHRAGKGGGGDILHPLCGWGEGMEAASHHHQGIRQIAEGFEPLSWSLDGLVEAAEKKTSKWLGVQWHPERSTGWARQAPLDWLVLSVG